MPPCVTLAMAAYPRICRARAERGNPFHRLAHLVLEPYDPDETLHRLLKIVLDCVRVLASRAALEWQQRFLDPALDLRIVDRRGAVGLGILSRVFAGALAEDDEVRERVAAQPVRAVDA